MVANGVVYAKAADGTLYTLDADTGALSWTTQADSFVVANGYLYVSVGDTLTAMTADSHAELWTTWPGPFSALPAVANGMIYVNSGSKLHALDATTGAEVWTSWCGYDEPVVADGTVFVASGPHLYARDALTGALRWKHYFVGDASAAPVVTNGVVYASWYEQWEGLPTVVALAAVTGRPLWGSGWWAASWAAANGVLYIGSDGHNRRALDAATGAEIWSMASNTYDSDPVVADGMVYMASDALFAFALP
jgi:outer membrane protein assembly factor BamB